MRKTLIAILAASAFTSAYAYEIELNGKTHQMDELISREVGPGITYKRLRSESYPLNVNILMMDVTNPYNRIETTTANNSAAGTEALVKAAKRQSYQGHRAIAGANANFWCVATQEPQYPLLSGSCFGGHGQNGKMITETNNWNLKWSGGWKHTGLVGIDANRNLHVGHHYYAGYINHTAYGYRQLGIHQINKLAAPGEVCLYNSYYGRTKEFRPVKLDINPASGKNEFMVTRENDCTEILLDFVEGNDWAISAPMRMIVKEVRLNAGNGTLADYDAALVGKGDTALLLAALHEGDEVEIETNYYDSSKNIIPLENFVVGNATIMIDGEPTKFNTTDNYCAQVYSRTCYGSSADGKTLYIIVIDKSTDPVYGRSAGCGTSVACEIAKHYGCANLVNFDAGGSAEMLLNGEIINRTTEGSPRAVSNGWLLYSIAPDDDEVARLEFDNLNLVAPPYSNFTPSIIAYNKYGDVISYDFHGFTLSCPEELGSCNGEVFTAGGTAMTGPLTAAYGDVSTTRDITIEAAEIVVRIPNLLIDRHRQYPIEVTAQIGDNTYFYNPQDLTWAIDDPSVVEISDGVLKGLAEGVTTITGTIGEVTTSAQVTVEEAASSVLALTDWLNWKVTAVGNTSAAISEQGEISFTYGINARTGTSLTIAKTAPYYSLPSSLWVEFTPSANVESLTADIRKPSDTRANNVDITPEQAYQAGQKARVELPIAEMCDPADLISFPLTFHSLKFNLVKDDALKGQAHTIAINALEALYPEPAGVEAVAVANSSEAAIAISSDHIAFTTGSALKSAYLYTLEGKVAASARANGQSGSIALPRAKGVYILCIDTAAGKITRKIVVK